MPIRTNGGVFNDQMLTGSLAHYVVTGADFSGAIDQYGQPVPFSAAEIIFNQIDASAYINIMNPNKFNLSFALERDRSTWTAGSLQEMIRGLGTDVGVDHVDVSNVIVEEVPYIFGIGSTGADTFLELEDTPDTYAGAAGQVVAVNSTETGLIFVPATASNAFAFVSVPSQPTIPAVGSDTLNVIPGTNVTITTNATSKELTINASTTASGDSIPIAGGGGATLELGEKYFVTSGGSISLPPITAADTPGQAIFISKKVSETVSIDVGNPSNVIHTDLGTTDSIEFDATQLLVFVVGDANSWELQIGSVN